MWDISWPKSMDSGWGRKPYWSGGMAFATATERPLRAAKCLAYSRAALDGAGAAAADRRERKIKTGRVKMARQYMWPPWKKVLGAKPVLQATRLAVRALRNKGVGLKVQRQSPHRTCQSLTAKIFGIPLLSEKRNEV